MNSAVFIVTVPIHGYKRFVHDWIMTEASTWTELVRQRKKTSSMWWCEVHFLICNNPKKVEYLRTKLFGKRGILTRKFWFAQIIPLE